MSSDKGPQKAPLTAHEVGCPVIVDVNDIDAIRRWGQRILDLDPYNDEVYLLLMRAERHRGNHAACLAIYRQATKALSEIGLDPGEELIRLVQSP